MKDHGRLWDNLEKIYVESMKWRYFETIFEEISEHSSQFLKHL